MNFNRPLQQMCSPDLDKRPTTIMSILLFFVLTLLIQAHQAIVCAKNDKKNGKHRVRRVGKSAESLRIPANVLDPEIAMPIDDKLPKNKVYMSKESDKTRGDNKGSSDKISSTKERTRDSWSQSKLSPFIDKTQQDSTKDSSGVPHDSLNEVTAKSHQSIEADKQEGGVIKEVTAKSHQSIDADKGNQLVKTDLRSSKLNFSAEVDIGAIQEPTHAPSEMATKPTRGDSD